MTTNRAPRNYKLGEIVPFVEVKALLPIGAGGGWFIQANGRKVYGCDGSHKDGTHGFKIMQFDGLD